MKHCETVMGLLLAFPILLAGATANAANPPAPSGPHPRLFLTGDILTQAMANAQVDGTAAQGLVKRCRETIDSPQNYMDRGGVDGDNWPGAAVACAFAWQATGQQEFLDSAIDFWNTALNDDQTKGDGLGCVVGATPDAAILTVHHDTGYPIRWYGPYMALVYDWLHDAPGVDAALLDHTRLCFKAWIDYYSQDGYLHDVAGSNYGAGYVAAKTLIAIAEGGEDGATSDAFWNSAIDDVFKTTLIGDGLAGSADPVGSPAGALVGGDWAEGWQYGPLSVLEYASSARALEENGVALPEMEAWAGDLALNYIYAQTPARDSFYSDGDLESDLTYPAPSGRILRAVYMGTADPDALGFARFMADSQGLAGGSHPLEAIAEVLGQRAMPVDFNAMDRPLFRLARGTRRVYARSGWAADAFWSVFTSGPHVVPDHDHVDAGNFVFSRGSDHLLVDPSSYGSRTTLTSNAPTIDADTVQGEYKPSQTAWSEAELTWARGSASGVVTARGDYAKAFNFSDTPSDIPFALRDWVFLPEGEIAVLDRARTNNAGEITYLNFHTPTELSQDATGYSATVGQSKLTIHTVALSAGTPSVQAVAVNENCYDGTCTTGRFAAYVYSVQIPGPSALGIHVLDALGSAEDPAQVASLNEAPYDNAGDNAGVVGAAIFRSMKQSYVVASSAQDGAAGATLSYGVPGSGAARHIVFDAPEGPNGKSDVTTTVNGDRCTISITAGTTYEGHPLMFQVGAAADGCAATEDLAVAPTQAPAGGTITRMGGTTGGGTAGSTATGNGGATGGANGGTTSAGGTTGTHSTAHSGSSNATPAADSKSGCGCRLTPAQSGKTSALFGLTVLLVVGRRRRRSRR